VKIFVANLPYKKRIIRRYKCTYNAPSFLLPPIELMYICGMLDNEKDVNIKFLDAIAENKDYSEFISIFKNFSPDIFITILGIETIDKEIRFLSEIKTNLPDCNIVAFGYLPTLFPEEILRKSAVDFIIKGEPEITVQKLYRALKTGSFENLKGINGLVYKNRNKISYGLPQKRIEELDSIPFPMREVININKYSEPLMAKPFTTIQSSRGCPFKCIYCVPSYGRKVVFRSAENVVEEIKVCINRFKIKSIRFMDDTFTLNKERVIKICNLIKKEKLKFKWSILSRPDTISEDVLNSMKSAGCKRIYLGIESGLQRFLDFYRRGYDLKVIERAVRVIKKSNIEVVGFFISGFPIETKDEFRKTIDFAKRLKCDYYILDNLMPYPGTELFKMKKDKIKFSLFPFISDFEDRDEIETRKREKEFYKAVYFNTKFILGKLFSLKFDLNNFISLLQHLKKERTKKELLDKFI